MKIDFEYVKTILPTMKRVIAEPLPSTEPPFGNRVMEAQFHPLYFFPPLIELFHFHSFVIHFKKCNSF